MGMEFASMWLRQVSPPASHDHFNHCRKVVTWPSRKLKICITRGKIHWFQKCYSFSIC